MPPLTPATEITRLSMLLPSPPLEADALRTRSSALRNSSSTSGYAKNSQAPDRIACRIRPPSWELLTAKMSHVGRAWRTSVTTLMAFWGSLSSATMPMSGCDCCITSTKNS